jgi:hypothetical protein
MTAPARCDDPGRDLRAARGQDAEVKGIASVKAIGIGCINRPMPFITDEQRYHSQDEGTRKCPEVAELAGPEYEPPSRVWLS